MKKLYSQFIKSGIIFTILLIGCISAAVSPIVGNDKIFTNDLIKDEVRPFDFSDRYYARNGIESDLIVNRVNGEDKFSVFDKINNGFHRNVRIVATLPAYNFDGSMLFYNLYGELFKDGFSEFEAGKQAVATANRYPIYVFPSQFLRDTNRQSALIDVRDDYFDKNPLGLGVIVEVEYTDRVYTKDAYVFLKELARKNGTNLDNTPIIRTIEELKNLLYRNLVSAKMRGLDDGSVPSFAIAKVIQNPENGAIAADAFLLMPGYNKRIISSEINFLNNFKCLQDSGSWCKK